MRILLHVGLVVAFAASPLAAGDFGSQTQGGSETRGSVRLQDIPLTVGTPSEIPTRIPRASSDGREIKIRVERIWKTGPHTHAAVRVQNTAQVAFNDVSIVCKAVDKENREIGTSRQSVDRGAGFNTFRPGAIANLDVVFDTPQSEVRALVCDARAHGPPQLVD